MTHYGDEQGEAGQGPRNGQYERQPWGSDEPRLGRQYGGEPTYTSPPPGQHSVGREHYAAPDAERPGPGGRPPYERQWTAEPDANHGAAPAWGTQQRFDRPPQHDPNSPYASFRGGYRLDPGPKRILGVPGLVVTIVGAVLLLLSFTLVNWFHNVSGDTFGSGGSSGKFGDVHDAVTQLKDRLDASPAFKGQYSFGVAPLYFSWLAWAMFGLAVVAAVVSALPTRLTPAMRLVSLLAGLGGAGVTIWAGNLFSAKGALQTALQSQLGFTPNFSFWVDHSYLGAWLAVGGFLVLAFGGVLGSSRQY